MRLALRLKAKSPRIISKDTVGAVDTLDIARADKESYRQKLRDGGHLVVAEAPSGSNAERIIALLEEAIGHVDQRADQHLEDGTNGVRVELPGDASSDESRGSDSAEFGGDRPLPEEAPAGGVQERPYAMIEARGDESPREGGLPWSEQEPRRAKTEAAPAGARVRAFTHNAPAEEQVTLLHEDVTVETRSCDRVLSADEVVAGGLFEERVFEVTEMREEPVVTKIAVVREEVIVRKIIRQRTQTIRDTVRQTEVQVEDLHGAEDPVFF